MLPVVTAASKFPLCGSRLACALFEIPKPQIPMHGLQFLLSEASRGDGILSARIEAGGVYDSSFMAVYLGA